MAATKITKKIMLTAAFTALVLSVLYITTAQGRGSRRGGRGRGPGGMMVGGRGGRRGARHRDRIRRVAIAIQR